MPFDQFFGEMKLPKADIDSRIDMAMAFYDSLMVLFLLYEQQAENNLINRTTLKSTLTESFYDVLASKDRLDDEYLQNMVNRQVDLIVDSTINHSNDPYYLSEDRATFIAEEQANNVGNYIDYDDAVKQGKYTKKTWNTLLDDRVRDTHMDIDGVTIPIDDVFEVGMSDMRFPKDDFYGASDEEIINCRCFLTFS